MNLLRDEGYVKFQCDWEKTAPLPMRTLSGLNAWRRKLYKLGLIGIYEDGIGFGNISVRAVKRGKFIISGTQTGGLQELDAHHYTRVVSYDFLKNQVACEGPIKASSESLTHAAIYECDPQVNAVLHVHHRPSWIKLLGKVPSTSAKSAYGTPEMAGEIFRLFEETDLPREKMLVMAGHEGGMVAFGKNLAEAGRVLLGHVGGTAIPFSGDSR